MIEPPFRNSKNPFLRKGAALAVRGAKPIVRRLGKTSAPSILVNSFPKSGTHLLSQVIDGFPGHHDLGEFIVSTPSLSMREHGAQRLNRRLEGLLPGEVAKAHLFWAPIHERTIHNRGTVTYFIYRDPRDVVVSEAHYLADMNRWHRLHREFSRLDPDERLMLAIEGSNRLLDRGIHYPNIAARFRRYAGWVTSPSTLSVRFEDLAGADQRHSVERIIRHYGSVAGDSASGSFERLVTAGISAIDPQLSHTFREGGGEGTWMRVFKEEHKDAFKRVANGTLIELGYESGSDW